MTPEEQADETQRRWHQLLRRFMVFFVATLGLAAVFFDSPTVRSAVILGMASIAIIGINFFVASVRIIPPILMGVIMNAIALAGMVAGIMLTRVFPQ